MGTTERAERTHNEAADLRREKALAEAEAWNERWRMDDEWRREQVFGEIDDDMNRAKRERHANATANLVSIVDDVLDAWDDLPAKLRERIEERYKDRVAEKGA